MNVGLIPVLVLILGAGCLSASTDPPPNEAFFSFARYEFEDGGSLEVTTGPIVTIWDADLQPVTALRVSYRLQTEGTTFDLHVSASSDLRLLRQESKLCLDLCQYMVSWEERGGPLPYGIGARNQPSSLENRFLSVQNVTEISYLGSAMLPDRFVLEGKPARLVALTRAAPPAHDAFPIRPSIGAGQAVSPGFRVFPGDERDAAGFGYTPKAAVDWFLGQKPDEAAKIDAGGCIAMLLLGRPSPAKEGTDVFPILSNDPTSFIYLEVSDGQGHATLWQFRRDHDAVTREARFSGLAKQQDDPAIRPCRDTSQFKTIEGALAIETRLRGLHSHPWHNYGIFTHAQGGYTLNHTRYTFNYYMDYVECSVGSCGGATDRLDVLPETMTLAWLQFDAKKLPLLDTAV